jgi:hypothetical protein
MSCTSQLTVVSVEIDSTAFTAGVKAGDTVVAVENIHVTSVLELKNAIAELRENGHHNATVTSVSQGGDIACVLSTLDLAHPRESLFENYGVSVEETAHDEEREDNWFDQEVRKSETQSGVKVGGGSDDYDDDDDDGQAEEDEGEGGVGQDSDEALSSGGSNHRVGCFQHVASGSMSTIADAKGWVKGSENFAASEFSIVFSEARVGLSLQVCIIALDAFPGNTCFFVVLFLLCIFSSFDEFSF